MDSTQYNTSELTGVLLAGGKSRRMGIDKRFLAFGAETLLQRALRVFEGLFAEIVIVVAQPMAELNHMRHRVVTDLIPDCGALGGLYTGLSVASHPRVFAAACDMPFLNPAVIGHLLTCRDADVVMPQLTTGLQPMHAVYSKVCLPYFERMLAMRNLSIQTVLEQRELRIRLVPEGVLRVFDAELLSFQNLNTPQDVERARMLFQRNQSPT